MARVAALMRDLADLTARFMMARLQLPTDVATELGLRLAEEFCAEVGGEQIYIPMGYTVRLSERDRAMYAEYQRTGRDVHATAKAFGCSVHTVYRRIKLVEAAEAQGRQIELFDGPQISGDHSATPDPPTKD